MALRNPFAVRQVKVDSQRADTPISEAPEYVVPHMGAYGVPPITQGAPYIKEPGWGPTLRTSTTETPSAQRLQTVPRRDLRPDPRYAPERYWTPRDADTAKRHGVESVDADGWEERKGIVAGQKRWKDNPRSVPVEEPRPTSRMAPRTYTFTRPFDQHSARYLNGTHFSMADHRRNYEILGMAPVRSMRNTYRIEPAPWDTDIVDLPPRGSSQEAMPEARLRSVEMASPGRSWRL